MAMSLGDNPISRFMNKFWKGTQELWGDAINLQHIRCVMGAYVEGGDDVLASCHLHGAQIMKNLGDTAASVFTCTGSVTVRVSL